MTTAEALSDALRRLANLITLGTIHSVSGDKCRVAIRSDAGHLTPPIKWIAGRASARKDWSQPGVGEQVVLLSPSGDFGNAIAVTGIYSAANPAPSINPDEHTTVMPDGAVFRYNSASGVLDITLPGGGITNLLSKLNVTGDTTISGDVAITGNMAVTGSALTHNGINVGSTHTHSGVMAGPSSTGVPQ